MKIIQGFGIAIAALTFCSEASAESMTLAHGFNPNHYWTSQIVEPWMACVTEQTAEEYTFEHFPSAQVVGFADSLEALKTGLSDVSTISIGYVTSEMPLNGISMLPDMGETSVQMVSAYRRMLDERSALYQEFTANGVYPLIVSLLPVYQLISTHAPVQSMGDFKGKVIRSSGGALTLTVNSLGAAANEMPSSDVYVGIQNGVVDGALTAISSIKPYNLQELIKSISDNGQFGSFTTLLAIRLDAYDALPDQTKSAFDTCARRVEQEVAAYLDAENEALKEEFSGMGIEVYSFPDDLQTEILDRLGPVTEEFIERLEARGLPAQATYNAYRAALKN